MDKLLEKHVAARLVSIALAFFLWLFVVNEQNPEIDRTIVVQPKLRGMPADLVLVEEVQPVSVRLRGRRNDIFAVAEDDLELYVNMAGAVEGENDPEVRLGNMPTGMQVVEIIPAHLPVYTERIIQEQLELQLSIIGQPAEGYVLGERQLSPTQVMVKGPRSQVEQIARVLAKVDAAGAAANIRAVVPVQVLDRQGNALNQDLNIRPEVVEVRIPVEKLPSKVLEIEPQITGSAAEGYQIDEVIVDPPAVEVHALQEVLDGLDGLETVPFDISGVADDAIQDLRLIIPGGVQSPRNRVRVTVRVSEITDQKTVNEVPVRVLNLGEGLAADLEPESIAVTVSGPYNSVNPLQPRDVTASVDTAGLETGEHRLKVRVGLPGDVQRVEVEPEVVTVIITDAEEEVPELGGRGKEDE